MTHEALSERVREALACMDVGLYRSARHLLEKGLREDDERDRTYAQVGDINWPSDESGPS